MTISNGHFEKMTVRLAMIVWPVRAIIYAMGRAAHMQGSQAHGPRL